MAALGSGALRRSAHHRWRQVRARRRGDGRPGAPSASGPLATPRALSTALQARITALGHLPLPFYPSFVVDDDPASGFEDGEPPPRFSHGYASSRGRLGVLVETHSWNTYPSACARHVPRRSQALLEQARARAPARAAADDADLADARLAGEDVVLLWKATAQARTIDFRGYRYQRTPSEISGATWTQYDETAPELWHIPLRDQLEPALTVTAPRAGYLVEAGFADAVAARLDAHAIRYVRLDAPFVDAGAEVFRATKVTYAPFEGRSRATVEGGWAREAIEVGAGALWVDLAQPRARLVLHLLEPTAPDSLVAWGLINAVFEQKEYLEGYIAEAVARQMLTDPAVQAAFDAALADPELAASPQRRLQWFHRRHPSWDAELDRIPWFRLDAAPVPPVR